MSIALNRSAHRHGAEGFKRARQASVRRQRAQPCRQLVRIVEITQSPLSDHFLRAVSQQALRTGIEQGNGAFGIGRDHRHLVGRIDHGLQPLPAFGGVLPRLLQLGHVGMRTGHPQRSSLPIPFEHAATVVDPYPLAVLVAHAEQADIVVAAAFKMILKCRVGRDDVIGMDQLQERLLAPGSSRR